MILTFYKECLPEDKTYLRKVTFSESALATGGKGQRNFRRNCAVRSNWQAKQVGSVQPFEATTLAVPPLTRETNMRRNPFKRGGETARTISWQKHKLASTDLFDFRK